MVGCLLKNVLVTWSLYCRRTSCVVSGVARRILVDVVSNSVKITLTKLQLFVVIHVVLHCMKLLSQSQIAARCVGVRDSRCRYN